MGEEEHVDPQQSERRNSPKLKKSQAEQRRPELNTLAAEPCLWNDKKYSDGAAVCDSHIRYECWNGKWVDVGQCEADTASGGGGSKGGGG